MEKVNRILHHPDYIRYLELNRKMEAERLFCKHTLEHMLDVARIAYILSLEQGLSIAKSCIYATALLHDIGRWMEYEKGVPHHEASAALAKDILQSVGFSSEEMENILDAIMLHRNNLNDHSCDLQAILYQADKKSRNCFYCNMSKECNWSDEKKNLYLEF